MAGIIKNQILKHLSKFTKNLSPDKIHVSTLKGEGDLSNLELDEKVLTQLLDLPTWIKISKAVCNRVAIKIQWTKLKSQPICLYLDEIQVDMETCSVIRSPNTGSSISDLSNTSGKYGLAEKIVDGMFVSINSVTINFKAPTFHASIQMSRIVVQSRTPTWERATDLRTTRIKDELRGQILLFKEAEWQTLRIEANALAIPGDNRSPNEPLLTTTPLRLIANQSKVRITMKKRLADCGIIASRLLVSLDDLLWVLTDSQLKAALSFVNSLKSIIKESSLQSKRFATDKLKRQGYHGSHSGHAASLNNHTHAQTAPAAKTGSKSQQMISRLFEKYDVRETSYHLHTTRVDLHLCDDSMPESEQFRRKVEGGALQLTFFKLCFDFYPFHLAGAERNHWLRFDENMATRHEWATQLLNSFRDDVTKIRSLFTNSAPTSPTSETAPSSGGASSQSNSKHTSNHVRQSQSANFGGGGGGGVTSADQGHSAAFQAAKNTKLLENSIIVRLEDLVVHQVSSSSSNKHSVPRKMISSDKKTLCLPPEMSSLHVEFTDYYFPDGIDFPDLQSLYLHKTGRLESRERKRLREQINDVLADAYLRCVPPSNVYMVINPLRVNVDVTTLLWLNAFLLNLKKSIVIPASIEPVYHADVRIEALMPRIIIPSECDKPDQPDRPTAMQIQISRAAISNTRQGQKTTLDDLKSAVLVHDNAKLFHIENGAFPLCSRAELSAFPDCVLDHLLGKDSPYVDKTMEEYLLTAYLPEPLRYGNVAADILQDGMNEEWEVLGDAGGASVVSGGGGGMTKSTTVESVSSMGLTYYSMRTDSLKKLADKDVWCVAIDQFWMEFVGAPSAHGRPQPFIESFPLTLWLFRPKASGCGGAKRSMAALLRKTSSTDTLRHCKETSPTTSHEQFEQRAEAVSCSGASSDAAGSQQTASSAQVPAAASQSDGIVGSRNGSRQPNNVNNVPNANSHSAVSQSSNSQHLDCDNTTTSDTSSRDDNSHSLADDKHVSDNTGDVNAKCNAANNGGNGSSGDNSSAVAAADVHVMVKIGGKVNVQLGHYQFLFLMRLVETMQQMQAELKADRRFITQQPIPQQAITVALVVREVEAALVGPPIAELPSPETSVDDSSDLNLDDAGIDDAVPTPLFDSASLDLMLQDDAAKLASLSPRSHSDINLPHRDADVTMPPPLTAHPSANHSHHRVLSSSSMKCNASFSEFTSTSTTTVTSAAATMTRTNQNAAEFTTDQSQPSNQFQFAKIDGSVISINRPTSNGAASTGAGTGAGTGSTPTLGRRKTSSQSLASSDGYASMSTSPKRDERLKKPVDLKKSFNSGLTSLSKGFGAFSSKFEKVKPSTMSGRRDEQDDEAWETQSNRSSDDDGLLLLGFDQRDELPAFEKHYHDVSSEDEAASSLFNMTTASNQPGNKQKGVVSIATFKLDNCEAFIQLDGDDVTVAATVDHVTPEELGNVLLDRFQERFATEGKSPNSDPHNFISGLLRLLRLNKNPAADIKEKSDASPAVDVAPVQLRFQLGPRAARYTSAAVDRGFLHMRVQRLQSTLGVASMASLADLVEDEKHGPVTPLLVDVCDSYITLQDNRPPGNVTSPGKVPIDLHISKLVIRRTEDGIFNIMGDSLPEDSLLDSKYVTQSSCQTTPSIERPATASPPPPATTATVQSTAVSNQPDLLGAIRAPLGGAGDDVTLKQRVTALEEENVELRRQLERIGKMSSQAGGIDHDALQTIQSECEHLRVKCAKLEAQKHEHAKLEALKKDHAKLEALKQDHAKLEALKQDHAKLEALKKDHESLLQQYASQAKTISDMDNEQRSLHATIQLLQQELMEVEQVRMREQRSAAAGAQSSQHKTQHQRPNKLK